MPGAATSDLLTAVVASRNRPHNLAGQLRLLATTGFPVIIADSSDPAPAAQIRAQCPERMQLLSYPPDVDLYEKLTRVLREVQTPFVLTVPDRKITFPHAIVNALVHLQEHPDCVCAQGYVIGFAERDTDIDINRVVFFTPTIDDADPLQRHYHLMRRYQSWVWGVFRAEPLRAAAAHARSVSGAVFQEVSLVSAIALQGTMARLGNVFCLQTIEESFNPLGRIDPFYWFLHDAGSFLRHYLDYRSSLQRFITDRGIAAPPGTDLTQLLDTVHAVWLHNNFDRGVLNHSAQRLLGFPLPPLPHPRPPMPWRELADGDLAHPGSGGSGARRYIWRREVLAAEPRAEIQIYPKEISRVERQLDIYFGD